MIKISAKIQQEIKRRMENQIMEQAVNEAMESDETRDIVNAEIRKQKELLKAHIIKTFKTK